MDWSIIDFAKVRLPKEVPRSPKPQPERRYKRHTRNLEAYVGQQFSYVNNTEMQCLRKYGKKKGWEMVARKQEEGSWHVWRLS